MNNINSIIEGLLFVKGEEGISLFELQQILDEYKPNDIVKALETLTENYDKSNNAFLIQKFNKHFYRMHTKPSLNIFLKKLVDIKQNSRLSLSTIEVLSIIAHKAPITKKQIEFIRNSDCSYQIARLKDKKLIKVIATEPGTRSNLYDITHNFYKVFNIKEDFEKVLQVDDTEINSLLDNKKEQLKNQKEQNNNKSKNLFNFDQE